MDKSIHGALSRLSQWLSRHHLSLVLLLSALHLGLAHMHVRDSGRTDGGVSNVDIDGNNSLYINTLGAAISTFETRPLVL